MTFKTYCFTKKLKKNSKNYNYFFDYDAKLKFYTYSPE